MKKKPYLISFLLVISLVLFVGCSKTKSPKDSFDEYITYMEKSDYTSMYKLLSSDAKKNVDEKYFADRYKSVYANAKVSKVTLKPAYPEKFKGENVSIPVEITLETPIGIKQFNYTANLIQENQDKNKGWFITWDEKMLLPELDKGEGIKFATKIGKRGEIKDKNGQGLAVNSSAVAIYVVPEKIQSDRNNIVSQLANDLGVTAEEIESKLNEPYVKSHPEQRARIMTLSREYEIEKARKAILLPGVSAPQESITLRYYPLGEASAQLIGYIDNINAEELEKYKSQGYESTDVLGKTGLESIYEKRLRGEVGGEIYTTDEKGNKKEVILQKDYKDGENITLTIDANLQKDMYEQLKGDSGTAVAVHPKTGEVLSMVSSPSYNPNVLVSEISNKNYLALEKDPKSPLSSRFSNAFVPGSTFKPITAAIGLKTGKLDPNKAVGIKGESWQADSSWGGYSVTRVHSEYTSLNLMDALVYSDNIYFAQTALAIGKDNFINGTKEFGIGEKINFPFPMLASQIGNLDDKEGIKLADSGYGQSEILMNPLQLALIYGSFVNEGNILSPILDMKDKGDTPKVWKEKVVSKEIADNITNDLIQVVERGTAKDAKISGLTYAGKTGTAELKQTQGETGKETGWFIAYNTVNPKLVALMMIEDVNGRGGSHYVLDKVKNIMSKYGK